MKRYKIFEDSKKRFMRQTEGQIHGFILWEVYHENNNFKLECWNMENEETGKIEPVIIQIWPNGKGYSMYVTPIDQNRVFTLFWLDGKNEIVKGKDVTDAMTKAGYGNGALRALDFHAKGNQVKEYNWNTTEKTWIKTK